MADRRDKLDGWDGIEEAERLCARLAAEGIVIIAIGQDRHSIAWSAPDPEIYRRIERWLPEIEQSIEYEKSDRERQGR